MIARSWFMVSALLLATSAQSFDVSLPQVQDSIMGYGKSANGAVSDKLFIPSAAA